MFGARPFSILLVAAGLVLSSPALAAEPTAADAESALQLYKEGKALREAGDRLAALEKLRAAYALVQTPITAIELGRTQIALGQLVEAREILLSVQRIPLRTNESAKASEARVDAEVLAAELRPRLAAITVRPKGTSDAPPKITVDGVVVPPEAAGVPRMLNPGAHVVVLEANGQRVQTDVTLADGQSRDLEIEVPRAAPPIVPVIRSPMAPAEPARRRLHPLVYTGFGTAVVGLTVGTITGILTLSTASSLKDTCRDGRCPASARDDIDSTSTTGTISTVGFIIGALGAAAGVVGLVISRPAESSTTTGFRIVPSGNGVGGSF